MSLHIFLYQAYDDIVLLLPEGKNQWDLILKFFEVLVISCEPVVIYVIKFDIILFRRGIYASRIKSIVFLLWGLLRNCFRKFWHEFIFFFGVFIVFTHIASRFALLFIAFEYKIPITACIMKRIKKNKTSRSLSRV